MMYDLTVVGGGVSGCACAYIAAKLGLKTLLIEKNIHLGGSITSGFVVPVMKTDTQNINCEFFNDFAAMMEEYGARITYKDGNTGWFNPEIAKIVLDKMMNLVGCKVLFDVTVHNISTRYVSNNNTKIMKNKFYRNISNRNLMIKKITFSHKALSQDIFSKYFIDATGDANFSKICDEDFLSAENISQAMTLRFLISGIDLEKFKNWITKIDKDENVTSYCYSKGELHLTTACTWDNKKWALRPIFEEAVKNGDIKQEDSAYFQLFTVAGMAGTVSLNCPRIPCCENFSPLNILDVSAALALGREQIWRIFNFCKKYFVGFENSYISNIADMLGIRESRRISGEYIYTEEDILSAKTFDNPACASDYPIDIHSIKKGNSNLEYVKQTYYLPIEALRSAKILNLYAVGRCLSATFKAQAAIRTQMNCFSMGEAVAHDIFNKINYHQE